MQISDTDGAAVVALLGDLRGFDVKLPPAVAKAVATAEAAQAGIAKLDADGQALTEVIRAHVEGDPVAPDRLLAVLTGVALASRPGDRERLLREVSTPVREAIRANSDRIVVGLRKPFDQAAATLDQAAAVLGSLDLDDLPAVTALGGDAAQRWQDATAAEKVVVRVQHCLVRMRKLSAYAVPARAEHGVLAWADLDLAGWRAVAAKPSPWVVRRVGTLSLATGAEFTDRADRLEREWQQQPESQGRPRAGQLATATRMVSR